MSPVITASDGNSFGTIEDKGLWEKLTSMPWDHCGAYSVRGS